MSCKVTLLLMWLQFWARCLFSLGPHQKACLQGSFLIACSDTFLKAVLEHKIVKHEEVLVASMFMIW